MLLTISRSLVLSLVGLSRDSIGGTRNPVTEGCVPGDVALGLLLAGLFLRLSGLS